LPAIIRLQKNLIMNNLLKSKTRLAFIQIIFENLSTENNIIEIFNSFDLNYKSTFVENFHNKKKIKFEFNSNYIKKLINYYYNLIETKNYLHLINKYINFDRKFEKWDIINKSILLAILSEIESSNIDKVKIILNDYLNISRSFIDQNEISIINAILDKIINVKK